MTAIHDALANEVRRMSELIPIPGRLADVVDVANLSRTADVPASAVTDVLDGVCPREVSDEVLQRLLEALKALQRDIETAPIRTAPSVRIYWCGKPLSPRQELAIAAWIETVVDPMPDADSTDAE
ncbi:hypothetical protein [Streptomyces sp. NPDC059378]|uniref:hypothetical protein n=1 Tax=Streptomyces sp. NPDC059378 TaxID=3346815 RepID=UPI00369B9951